jgi:subfamily B ATP-binding cassette protein MsbA
MNQLSPDTQATPFEQAETRGSTWKVYRRLMACAWAYKGRLMLSLFFALVIAASFSSIVVGVGAVIDLTFYQAEYKEDGTLRKVDPADRYAQNIQDASAKLEQMIGWAPRDWDTRFKQRVLDMRKNSMGALIGVSIVAIVLSIVIGVARYLQEYFAGAIGANISADLAEAMYANLMRQSVGFFEKRGTGDILARFTNDIFMVNRGLSGVFVKLMREPFKAIGFLAIAIYTDPWLTLVGALVLPPVGITLNLLGQKTRVSTRRSLQKIASMAGVVNEAIGGIAIIKGYNMEAYETGRVRTEVTKLRKFLKKMVQADALTGPITEFIMVLGLVAFVLLSGHRVATGQLAYGDLVTLFSAILLMLDPVRKLSSVNNMIQTSVASGERVFELIDAEPDIVESPGAVPLSPMKEVLRFENVSFSYDGTETVLDNINLEIRKGEMVALVGFSGAGKSTLVKMIPRFYDPTAGRITIDGVDIRDVTFHSLRDQLSIVTQDTVLFAESVRDNIAYGEARFTEERVRDAARAANADAFVQKLVSGYDTVLSESGASLSGGQRQRLAIARAIIKDPAILILDEATSSLDSESERLIQDALDRFVTGRTAIVIAHRLSTVQRADRIIVMEAGRIAEQGTHAELLAHGGIYQRLHATQFGTRPEQA